MDSIDREITNYMVSSSDASAEAVQAARNIAQAIDTTSVQSNLLLLIQSMGQYLTNEDDSIRAKATGLLSTTLRNCTLSNMNDAAISVLVDFYCDRLTDRSCVPNLMEGLIALSEAENFSGTNAVTVATRIFERVDVQRFPQATRNAVFRVFENLLQKHLLSLRAINNEFVYGFTQAMDGEKDPRNLMCAFKLVKDIIQHFDISAHIEDLFEVTFCYFPITFKPPPDDPYGITADDLKQSLRQCLSATGHFAKLAVPLILEKLLSTSGSAKKDSMETLAACAPVYGAFAFLPVIDEIFDSLKVEVFHSTDPALEEAALVAIRSVVATLSAAANTPAGDPTEKTLKPLVVECIANLKEPELKNAKPASHILRAASSASDSACNSIVDAVVPLLLRQYRETEIATRRKAILDVLLEFLEAGRSLYGSADDEDVDMDQSVVSPLVAYKDRLFPMCESALLESNEYNGLRLAGLKGLELMALSKDYLTQDERGIAVQAFNRILLDESDAELRSAALGSLKAISHIDSKYLVEQTVPGLVNHMPASSEEKPVIGYKQLLVAIKTLCPVQPLFKAVMPLLLQKFDELCTAEKSPTYPCAILQTLLDILHTKVDEKHDDISTCIQALVPHLTSAVIKASLDNSETNRLVLDKDIMKTIALIVMLVVESLDSTSQKEFVDRTFRLFLEGDLSQLSIAGTNFHPLTTTASDAQKMSTQLFAAVVCACRKDIVFPVTSTESFLDMIIKVALETNNEVQHISMARITGSIINKWKDASALSAYVEKLRGELQQMIEQTESGYSNALSIYLWVAKALILKANHLGYELTNQVIAWCSNPALGKQASGGFDILIGDDSLALNKASFATMTVLYKQRFFTECLPKLMSGFRDAPEDIKHNYLIALSYLLRNVPKQILLGELPPLVPLLIQSLSLPDTTLRVSTLDTFRLAIMEAPDAIKPHVRSIIPALIGLLEVNDKNPMQVRIASLRCLAQFPSGLSIDVLLPHINYVIKQLARSLDDKKRLVRKEAVDCRAKWYAIAA